MSPSLRHYLVFSVHQETVVSRTFSGVSLSVGEPFLGVLCPSSSQIYVFAKRRFYNQCLFYPMSVFVRKFPTNVGVPTNARRDGVFPPRCERSVRRGRWENLETRGSVSVPSPSLPPSGRYQLTPTHVVLLRRHRLSSRVVHGTYSITNDFRKL